MDPELDPGTSDNADWWDQNQLPVPYVSGQTHAPYAPPPGTPGLSYTPGYNAVANGGYDGPPPIDTATGTYPAGWGQDPSTGLWNFTPETAAPATPAQTSGSSAPGPQQIVPFSGSNGTGDYTTPARPAWLSQPYVPPTWKPPSMADVQNEPGFALGLSTGLQARERSAAARGSILNGGTQKALDRYATDYAGSKYQDAWDRSFNAYQTDASLGAQARAMNEAAYNTDVGNALNQYQTRYQNYLDLITNQRNAQNDYWGQQMDLAHNALTAAGLTRPSYPNT